jgi:Homocysteine S-methyltransferase
LSPNLRELLETRVLIGDGAVGTLLGERGVGHPYARANLSHPEMVTDIHTEYLRAGADAIETNTFTDLSELRLAHEAVETLGAPVLAYKTFVEDGETLAEGLPGRAAREISSWGAGQAQDAPPCGGQDRTG